MIQNILSFGFPIWGELLLAVLLDVLLGDPSWFPHPVKLIGKIISGLEKGLRRWIEHHSMLDRRSDEKKAGVVLAVITVSITMLIAWGIPYALHIWISPFAASIARIIMLYFALALRSLAKAGKKVRNSLENNQLDQARDNLSHMVGRDTKKLSKQGVARAACESVAENTTDGVIAPLCFIILGMFFGHSAWPVVFVWGYKAASTLDSMVGYQDLKYQYLGWFSAKLDDVLAYIPARISAAMLIIASAILQKNWKGSFLSATTEHANHHSPNGGWSEAAVSGALGIRMGGGAYYGGVWREAPRIGIDLHPPSGKDIDDSIKLMLIASAVTILIGVLLPQALLMIAIIMIIAGFRGKMRPFPPFGRRP